MSRPDPSALAVWSPSSTLPPAPAPTARDVWGIVAGAAGVAVLLWPLRAYAGPQLSGKDAPKFRLDSFPLSTYPMFSEHRGRSTYVPHVIGLTGAGERVIPHARHFGGGGLNQVRKQVSRAIRRGDAALVAQTYADSLAAQRAAREGGRPSGGSGGPRRRHEAAVQQVEVVRSRFRFDDYYGGDVLPHRETVLARCEVGGTAVAVREKRTADEIAGGVAR